MWLTRSFVGLIHLFAFRLSQSVKVVVSCIVCQLTGTSSTDGGTYVATGIHLAVSHAEESLRIQRMLMVWHVWTGNT
jgi:hypothetical protein